MMNSNDGSGSIYMHIFPVLFVLSPACIVRFSMHPSVFTILGTYVGSTCWQIELGVPSGACI